MKTTKVKRFYITFAALILVMLGASGCMSDNYTKYFEEYIANEYGQSTEIVQLTEEFSGDKGKFARAVCKAEGFEEKFVVYFYEKEFDNFEKVKLGDIEFSVHSTYTELLVQKEYAEYLRSVLPEAADIKCRVSYDDYYNIPTKEDVAKGIDHSLGEEYRSYVELYIIADKQLYSAGFLSKMEEILLKQKAYEQYVHTGFVYDYSYMDAEEYNEKFYEVEDFTEYMLNNGYIERMDYVKISRETGVVRRVVEKE